MKKQQLVDQLTHNFGFTQQHAKLFLASLSLGPSLMAPLAHEARLPRSTAYYVAKELQRRGFLTTKKRGKRTYFVPTSTKRFTSMIKEREKITRKLLPHLKKIEKRAK